MAAGTGFPYVLYDLLKKESAAIVMWTSTGTAFGIRDMAAFRQDVLTCYFKHNKFSSFQRQLNLYGFRKVVKGRESGCYMHPSFLRDNPEKLTEVKRGVVPPCPPHYSRKIYGSGPRFMSQDDGSDSEPELVVQPRGHWDKNLGATDVATHMRLGEMHMSAAAYAAARAQIKGDVSGMNSGHAAARAAAAAQHLQAAQAHMHGLPGDPRAPSGMGMGMMGPPQQGMSVGRIGAPQGMDMRAMGPPPQQGGPGLSVGGGGGGSGGGGGGFGGSSGGPKGGGGGAGGSTDGGESSRGRPGRTGLSKMFGSNRTVAGASMPSNSAFLGGGSASSSQHRQVQQQQQQHLQQQMQKRFNASSMPESQSGGRGQTGSSQVFLPPIASAGGQQGGMPMGGPGGAHSKGITEGAHFRPGQSSTVLSLSRLLEGLEQTLDSPLEEEMFMPIDKRNSFCAQMVNIAQVLEDDPSMQQSTDEARNTQFSYLAQKRRSSVSELAAYLHDMLEEGESRHHMANAPAYTLPPPIPHGASDYSSKDWSGNGGGNGNGNSGGSGSGSSSGNGNRVTFKRMHNDDFGSYGAYGDMGGGEGSGAEGDKGAATASGWTGATSGNGGERGEGAPRPNPKRARATLQLPAPHAGAEVERPGGGKGADEGAASNRRSSRRMSEGRLNATVVANPAVAQALTCLASGLPGHSDSEDSGKDGPAEGAIKGEDSTPRASKKGDDASESVVKSEELSAEDSSARRGEEGAAGSPPTRRGSTAINEVLTSYSIDRALEQLKSDGDTEQSRTSTQKSLRHRASVYVLMHAIAAVGAANDSGWEQEGQEPLDGVEGAEETVASAI